MDRVMARGRELRSEVGGQLAGSMSEQTPCPGPPTNTRSQGAATEYFVHPVHVHVHGPAPHL
jgi:hypothetical protein